MSELRGCSDGGCIIRKPEGMHTNGGCGCERELRQALGLQDSRRFIHALRERQREVAELRGALESVKRYALGGESHAREWYPNLAGDFSAITAVVSDALKPHAQGGSES